jgi:beta-phosphoglucomutase
MGDGLDAVLFDFNGVLVDDEEHHRRAFATVLAHDAIPLTRDAYYRDYLGLNDRTCFLTAYARAGRTLTADGAERLVAEKARAYAAATEAALPLVPGVAPFVARAARHFRLAIVSGALREEVEGGLERAGLTSYFEVIVAAEDVGPCKPDPAGYRAACAALGRRGPVTPTHCVAIEDSLPGLAAARAAGLRCAMLATSHSEGSLAGADLVWRSFEGHDPLDLLALCP